MAKKKAYQGKDNASLEALRAKIDECDEQIVELLARRFELVRKIGMYKANHNLPVLDEKREGELLSRKRQQASRVKNYLVESIFEIILDESRRIQKDLRKGHKANKLDCKSMAVIGLGLIGTSICLALKEAKVESKILGFDLDRVKAEKVLAMGAIDRLADDIAHCVEQADLVIIAVPIRAIKEVLIEIAPYVKPGSVVLDVGSTKKLVCQWADDFLPEHAFFIGGHPMTGKASTTVELADKDLFRGYFFITTPAVKTNKKAMTLAKQFIKVLGMKEKPMKSSHHDKLVTWASDLPFIVATCLLSAAAKRSSWPETKMLASKGFYDTTRLASGSPQMYTDICLSNRESVIDAIALLITELKAAQRLVLHQDANGLMSLFTTAKYTRDKWLDEVRRVNR